MSLTVEEAREAWFHVKVPCKLCNGEPYKDKECLGCRGQGVRTTIVTLPELAKLLRLMQKPCRRRFEPYRDGIGWSCNRPEGHAGGCACSSRRE